MKERAAGKTMALVLGSLLSAVACSTTQFKSTWKDPTVSQVDFRGKRVGAFVITNSEPLRRSAEDALARALGTHGVQAIPGYQLIPDEGTQNKESLRNKLVALGVEGA